MEKTTFKTRGVCARSIDLETEDGVIIDVKFNGGCDGNLKAISRLVKGQKVEDVADILEGNTCGNRSTSCADQLSQALRSVSA